MNQLFFEEKKEIWVLCQSSINAMGIGSYFISASQIRNLAFVIEKLF